MENRLVLYLLLLLSMLQCPEYLSAATPLLYLWNTTTLAYDNVHVVLPDNAPAKKESFYTTPTTEKFRFHSHPSTKQDAQILDIYHDLMHDGFYIDFTAKDFAENSNTYILDRFNLWKGVCIEPDVEFHLPLLTNRRCQLFGVLPTDIIASRGGVSDQQHHNQFHKSRHNKMHNNNHANDNNNTNSDKNTMNHDAATLWSILAIAKAPTFIHYMSLDIPVKYHEKYRSTTTVHKHYNDHAPTTDNHFDGTTNSSNSNSNSNIRPTHHTIISNHDTFDNERFSFSPDSTIATIHQNVHSAAVHHHHHDIYHHILSTFFLENHLLDHNIHHHYQHHHHPIHPFIILIITITRPSATTHQLLVKNGYVLVKMLSEASEIVLYLHHRHPEFYDIMRKHYDVSVIVQHVKNNPQSMNQNSNIKNNEDKYKFHGEYLLLPEWKGYFVGPPFLVPPHHEMR